jgi:predicted ATP-binding protein involved in virulence
MYIKEVKVSNIRNVDQLQLKFTESPGWHVLIGDNGAGKSTILRAIALAIIGPSEATALRLELDKYVRKGESEGWIELNVERDLELDRYTVTSRPLERPFDAGIKISKNGENGRSIGKIEALKEYKYAKRYIWSGRDGWFSASFGPFRRFTGGNKDWNKVYYANPRAGAHLSVFGEDVALTESLEWLRELNYKRLEGDAEASALLENLRSFINEGKLLPHDSAIEDVSSEGVQLRDGNGHQIDITEMSDGFRSILSLTFELLRQMVLVYGSRKVFQNVTEGDYTIPMPGIVLVDEIDAHLHPTWQARIGTWFTQYFPKVQFIVTTHSPIICRAAEKGSIWRLAAPGSSRPSGEVTGIEKKRLVFGNILDAFSTELFGAETSSSQQTTEMLEELASLNKKSVLGVISNQEKSRREELLRILPTTKPSAQ